MLRELFQKVQNKLVHIFILLLMMANISDLIHFAFTYHLFVPSQVLLTVPESARFISDDQYYFILDPYTSWNDVFLKRGWSTKQEVESYVFMKNFLYPNSNLIVNKKNYAINTGAFHLRRVEYMKNLIEKLVSKEKGVITPYIHNLLEIIGIRTIVSGYPLKGDMLQEETVLIHNDSTIYIYTLAYPKSDWYYIPQTLERVEFIDDFEKKITDRSITARNAVAEGIEKRENNSEYTITNSNGYNDRFELSGNFKNDTFIALRINYYPEWSVLIDGKKTAIYKTNLTHMGLNVPKGKHEVVIRYENWYFKIGLVLSLFATAGCAFILVKSKRL
ncbi:YfhO family protein [Candidatus Roizmanbacteria bacterium]|nr:YfhO family protein [Candidatus Roizmanbacteria bacterium]